jgi:serine/threonine protein kinase
MELVEGETHSDIVRRGPVPVAESAAYACQALSAVGYAHERGVIHRDIKPTNIVVTPSHIVKLLYFGIATTAGFLEDRLTAAGAVMKELAVYTGPIARIVVQRAAGQARNRRQLYENRGLGDRRPVTPGRISRRKPPG